MTAWIVVATLGAMLMAAGFHRCHVTAEDVGLLVAIAFGIGCLVIALAI